MLNIGVLQLCFITVDPDSKVCAWSMRQAMRQGTTPCVHHDTRLRVMGLHEVISSEIVPVFAASSKQRRHTSCVSSIMGYYIHRILLLPLLDQNHVLLYPRGRTSKMESLLKFFHLFIPDSRRLWFLSRFCSLLRSSQYEIVMEGIVRFRLRESTRL